jgi:hypothetical protein
MKEKKRTRCALMLLALCAAVPRLALSQTVETSRSSSPEVQNRVELIVRNSAKPLVLSNPSSQVEISSQQLVLAPQDVREIQRYGIQAVPSLSTFLASSDARSERVAIRLLGAIGGPAVVDPLLKVLRSSPRAGSREEALRSLAQAPCNEAVARALAHTAENDPNAIVRDLARRRSDSCSI